MGKNLLILRIRPYERGFSRYIDPEPRELRRGPVNL
jgi:hypothetical protein